ncbi:MAG: peroxidase family protein, partial [Pseudomonadota bacterium]
MHLQIGRGQSRTRVEEETTSDLTPLRRQRQDDNGERQDGSQRANQSGNQGGIDRPGRGDNDRAGFGRGDNDGRQKHSDEELTIIARTTDGANTNAEHPEWGATHQELLRLAPNSFADGISEIDTTLPNARLVSNTLAAQTEDTVNSFGASNLLWAWGQFIDHDLDLTEAGETGASPILVPFGDPVFADGAIIPFNRVEAVEGTGENDVEAAYENEITAYLDASMVYGSDAETAASLRDGAYLILDDDGLLVQTEDGGVLAGDVRAAENIALTSLHTLFAREHNRWVDKLAEE